MTDRLAGDRAGASAGRHGGSGRPPTSRTSRARSPRRRPTCATRSRIRGCASTRSRRTTSRRSSRRSRRTGWARTSCRAASGRRPRGPASPNERITLEGIGKTDADLRAAVARGARRPTARAGSRSSRPRRRRPWPRSRRRARRRARASTSCTGSTRTSRPRPSPAWRSAPGGSKFGMTEMEIADAIERGGGPDGPLAVARDPPPRRLAARRRRCLARRRPARPRRDRPVARLDRDVRHARRRWRLPGLRARRSGAEPGSVRARAPGPARGDSRPIGGRPASPSSPAGSSWPGRAGSLARVLHVRDRGGRQVVLDAGMTELIRPALYGARHRIVALTSLGRAGRRPRPGRSAVEPAAVEGPICESTDSLGDPRPAAAPPRRPRRHRRCGCLRGVAVVDLQRPAASAAGPARSGRRLDPRSSARAARRVGLAREYRPSSATTSPPRVRAHRRAAVVGRDRVGSGHRCLGGPVLDGL